MQLTACEKWTMVFTEVAAEWGSVQGRRRGDVLASNRDVRACDQKYVVAQRCPSGCKAGATCTIPYTYQAPRCLTVRRLALYIRMRGRFT